MRQKQEESSESETIDSDTSLRDARNKKREEKGEDTGGVHIDQKVTTQDVASNKRIEQMSEIPRFVDETMYWPYQNDMIVQLRNGEILDTEIIAESADMGRIMTLEDHNVINGFGAAVAEHAYVPLSHRIGVQDLFGQSGDPVKDLLPEYGMAPVQIAQRVLAPFGR